MTELSTEKVSLTRAERAELWKGWETPSVGYTRTVGIVEQIVAARVAEAKAGAWDEGYRASWRDTANAVTTNPYRTGGES